MNLDAATEIMDVGPARSCFICLNLIPESRIPEVDINFFERFCNVFCFPVLAEEKWGTVPNDNFCSDCISAIGEAAETYSNVLNLQKRLDALKNELREKIFKSYHLNPMHFKSSIDVIRSVLAQCLSECRVNLTTILSVPETKCLDEEHDEIDASYDEPMGDEIGITELSMAKNSEDSEIGDHSLENQSDATQIRRTYKCQLCPRRFLTENSRRAHLKVHKSGKPFQCQLCKEGFTLANNLTRHMKNRHQYKPELPNPTQNGPLSFPPTTLVSEASEGDSSSCVEGYSGYSHPSTFDESLYQHDTKESQEITMARIYYHDLEPYSGNMSNPLCMEVISTANLDEAAEDENTLMSDQEEILDIKPLIHHPFEADDDVTLPLNPLSSSAGKDIAKGSFQCQQCSRCFQSETSLRSHTKFHKTNKPFSCYICSEGFTLINNVKRHMKKNHPEIGDSSCPLCGYKFKSENPQADGEVMNTDLYRCILNDCGRSFQTLDQLRRHHISECADISRHNGAGSANDVELTSAYEDEKRQIDGKDASITNDVYPSREQEQRDTSILQTDKRATEDELTSFRETEYEPIDMDETDLGASEIESAMSSHPFVCTVCQKRFTLLNNLRRHFRLHGKIATSICPLCRLDFNTQMASGLYICPDKNCRRKFNTVERFQGHHILKCPKNPRIRSTKTLSVSEEEIQAGGLDFQSHQEAVTAQPVWPSSYVPVVMENPDADSGEAENPSASLCYLDTGAPEDSSTTASNPNRVVANASTHPFCCRFCNQRFTLLSNLRRHFKSHGESFVSMCPLCGLDFNSQISWQGYTCRLNDCNRSFDTIARIQAHHTVKCPENPRRQSNANNPEVIQHEGKSFADSVLPQ